MGISVLLSMSLIAAAPPPTEAEEGAAGYCDWLAGVAQAESSVLMGPQLFASGGLYNALSAAGTETTGPRPRFLLGIQYDFVNLYQGLTLHNRAAAECRAFRASQRLEAQLADSGQAGLAEALAARSEVLTRALPRAEAILSQLRVELAEARSTLSELQEAELKVDGLRALLLQTARERAALVAPTGPQEERLSTLLEERRAADREVQRLSARLRESSAWSVSVRAGYDRVLGLESTIPIMGMVNLTYNLGGLFQPAAHARAENGRQRWAAGEIRGVERKAEHARAELRAVREVEMARLKQTAALLSALEGRQRDIEGISAKPGRRLSELLWFEQVRLQAERAWLAAHVVTIERLLEEEEAR